MLLYNNKELKKKDKRNWKDLLEKMQALVTHLLVLIHSEEEIWNQK